MQRFDTSKKSFEGGKTPSLRPQMTAERAASVCMHSPIEAAALGGSFTYYSRPNSWFTIVPIILKIMLA